jgi:SAM-dependent methyltransferase
MASDAAADAYARRYDALTERSIFAELYGGSGFFNVGLWGEGAASPAAAATRLAAEIVARLPAGTLRVLEVAAGAGGTAREAARRRPEIAWTATDLSLRRLHAARRGAPPSLPELRAAAIDACRPPFSEAAFDAVVAVEAAFHFPSRAGFLAEARRVLRPGGALLLTDLVVAGEAGLDPWMLPAANLTPSVAAYAELYGAAGLELERCEDWSERTYRPFLQFLDGRDRARESAGEIDSSERRRAAATRARLVDRSAGFLGYFAVIARRPEERRR